MAAFSSFCRSFFCLIFILLFCSGVAPKEHSSTDPEFQLQRNEVSAHLRFLASDELLGRMTGTQGNKVAARYIAEQFRANGLATPAGQDDYFQIVPLEKTLPSRFNRVVILGDTLYQGKDILTLNETAAGLEAPTIFLSREEMNEKSLSQKNVAGKIVITFFGAPEGARLRSGFRQGRQRRELVMQQGALALVELYRADIPWARLTGFLSGPRFEIATDAEDEETDPGSDIPHILINDESQQLGSRISEQKSRSAFIVTHLPTRRHIESQNVVGFIPGQDPALQDQYILLTAHYDHIGSGPRPGITAADTIFNGARDNGMGTVALLSAAKALAKQPPARSVICVAFTGEEMGILGSTYYGDHPLVPLEQTVFNLNSDNGGYSDTTIVTVLGLERNTAREAIEKASSEAHLQVIQDPSPEQRLFERSDNIVFSKKGIPSVTFSAGFRSFYDEGVQRYYHQPQDEADRSFNFNYLLQFCRAYAHSARYLANLTEPPRWQKGDEYEAVWQTFHTGK